jgi:hypothetical protein
LVEKRGFFKEKLPYASPLERSLGIWRHVDMIAEKLKVLARKHDEVVRPEHNGSAGSAIAGAGG